MKTIKSITRFQGSLSTPILTLEIKSLGNKQFLIVERNCYSSGCYCSNHPQFMEETGSLARAVQVLKRNRGYASYEACLASYE